MTEDADKKLFSEDAEPEVREQQLSLFEMEPEESPPAEFQEFDESIACDYKCPRCAYEWSGRPR